MLGYLLLMSTLVSPPLGHISWHHIRNFPCNYKEVEIWIPSCCVKMCVPAFLRGQLQATSSQCTLGAVMNMACYQSWPNSDFRLFLSVLYSSVNQRDKEINKTFTIKCNGIRLYSKCISVYSLTIFNCLDVIVKSLLLI